MYSAGAVPGVDPLSVRPRLGEDGWIPDDEEQANTTYG